MFIFANKGSGGLSQTNNPPPPNSQPPAPTPIIHMSCFKPNALNMEYLIFSYCTIFGSLFVFNDK